MIKLTKEEALKSKTFCILPFNHLFVQPDGAVQACCVSTDFKTPANVKNVSIERAFNSDNHIQLRKDMLTGIENRACEFCYKNEKITGYSSRLMYQDYLEKDQYSLPEIQDNYTVSPDFEHIDIRFSNLCNLKCRMCNHIYSSEWYEDTIALNKLPEGQTKVVKVGNNITKRLEKHISKIKTVYFAGGEPLLMPEHLDTLKSITLLHKDNLDANGKIDISIHYNTNLKVLRHDGVEFIEYWKKYRYVNLSISCDGIGHVGEYQRVGFKSKTLIENLNKLKVQGFIPSTIGSELNNLSYNFQYTVTPLNILHLPKFIKFLLENKYITASSTVDFRYAFEPEEFNIRNITNVEYVEKELRQNIYNFDESSMKRLEELIEYMKQPPVLKPEEIFEHYSTLDKFNKKTTNATYTPFVENLFI